MDGWVGVEVPIYCGNGRYIQSHDRWVRQSWARGHWALPQPQPQQEDRSDWCVCVCGWSVGKPQRGWLEEGQRCEHEWTEWTMLYMKGGVWDWMR